LPRLTLLALLLALAANDTSGQIGVSGSDRATIINSPYSTGQNSASPSFPLAPLALSLSS